MKRLLILVLFVAASATLFAQSSKKAKYNKEHSTTAKATYTCPMDPEITSSKPGKCSKCGMKLVKAKSVVYTCPMDPDVVSDKPGKCPKCGMTLEEKKGGKDLKMKG